MKQRPKIIIASRDNKARPSIKIGAAPPPRKFPQFTLAHLPPWVCSASFLLAAGSTLVVVVLIAVISGRNTEITYEDEYLPLPDDIAAAGIEQKFNIEKKDFEILPDYLAEDVPLEQFLLNRDVPADKATALAQQAAAQQISFIRKDKDINIGYSPENMNTPQFIEFLSDDAKIVTLFVTPEPSVSIEQKELETRIETKPAIIKSSFYDAIADAEIDVQLIPLIEDALKWAVDLYHLQKSDRFMVVYETQYVGELKVKLGRLLAVRFEPSEKNKNHTAYFFEWDGTGSFRDENGDPVEQTFLQSPIKYGRISSRYNLERVHPVLKVEKPHYGTDYAAPEGTDIFAVADGKVIKAETKGGNGLYVKIDHGQKIETQYLHMSNLGPGIRYGALVKQGQTIGYVGKTGLASGPHVCFRFWEDGKQIDHLQKPLSQPKRLMGMREEEQFFRQRDSLHNLLEQAKFRKQ